MAVTHSPERLRRNQLGMFGIIMPGLAQVAPAFNLFFTTGYMVFYAGASAPLIFLISMVAMGATASSLAQFSGIYPSAGSFITYITRAIVTKVAVVVGLKCGVRVTIALYVFEVVLLLALSLTILARGGASGLSGTPFSWPGGKASDVLLAFSLAVLAFGGFEAAAPLAEETRDPRRTVPIAVLGAVIVTGIIYVLGSYALVTAFGVGHAGALAADGNPFHTAAKAFIPFVAPLITWVFLSSVTSSYVAANTQTSRVIFAGARGGLAMRALAGV